MYSRVYTEAMNVTEARRKMLSLVDNLPDEGIVLTKRGEPCARLMPVRKTRPGRYVTGPLLEGKGLPGPKCPSKETPYDLLFD